MNDSKRLKKYLKEGWTIRTLSTLSEWIGAYTGDLSCMDGEGATLWEYLSPIGVSLLALINPDGEIGARVQIRDGKYGQIYGGEFGALSKHIRSFTNLVKVDGVWSMDEVSISPVQYEKVILTGMQKIGSNREEVVLTLPNLQYVDGESVSYDWSVDFDISGSYRSLVKEMIDDPEVKGIRYELPKALDGMCFKSFELVVRTRKDIMEDTTAVIERRVASSVNIRIYCDLDMGYVKQGREYI